MLFIEEAYYVEGDNKCKMIPDNAVIHNKHERL